MPRHLPVLLLALLLALAPRGPAAQSPGPEEEAGRAQERAAELAREATEKLLRALQLLLDSLPQYGPPRIDEEGNIIIPRLKRRPPAEPSGPAGTPR